MKFLADKGVVKKLHKFEEYFDALEAYNQEIKSMVHFEGAIDLDAQEETEEREVLLVSMAPGEQLKVIFQANVKLYEWKIADRAERALESVEKNFIPMPMKPHYKGSIYGTIVLTLQAKEEVEMEAFDILRLVKESRRNRSYSRHKEEIIIAVKIEEWTGE